MPHQSVNTLHIPVQAGERITLLDSLRGIALLGILLMNIPGFSLPEPANYGDMAVLNEKGTINFKVWYFIEMSVAGTQRALFSMLFGVGIILFISRKEKSSEGLMPAEYFFRRQIWLLVFGLVNAFVLLWFWDILFQYAICGMLIFVFRRLSPKHLVIAAACCLVLQLARDNTFLYRTKAMIAKGERVAAKDTTKIKLNDEEKEQLDAMTGFKTSTTLEARKKTAEKNIRKVRSDYNTFYAFMSQKSYEEEMEFTYNGIWDILIFMFLGMAFYKSGILLGNAPIRTYWIFCIAGLALGAFLSWQRLQFSIGNDFDRFTGTKKMLFQDYELARTARSIGIFGLIMLLYKSKLFGWMFALVRPVGQMAFTNYLMQSFLMGVVFYGVGFGMFGQLPRYQTYMVVGATWIVQIIYSHIWLRYFQFGPLEWLWRSLTYWKFQPIKKNKHSAPTMNIRLKAH